MSHVERKVGFGPAFLGGVFALVVLGAIASWWFRAAAPKEADYQIQRGKVRLEKRAEIEKEALEQLTVPAVTDPEKGVVRVPIERAMRIIAAELANKPVRPSQVAVEVPYPYGLRPPPPAPEAAPISETAPTPEPAPAPEAATASETAPTPEAAPAPEAAQPSDPSNQPAAPAAQSALEATLP